MRPIESALYRLFGVNARQEMPAAVYIAGFVSFRAGCAILLFLVLMLQRLLPGGPADVYLTTSMTTDLAANTAVSFTTTTTWQAYAGENTLRYLAQVIGLVAQSFLAGGAGLAAGFAFIRGIARELAATIGNFWVDLIRSLLWVILPLTLLGSLILFWQGVPLNTAPYTSALTLEGRTQIIAHGPVAALEFIKNLGTNGASSTPMEGIPMRIRRRSRILSGCLRSQSCLRR
jgi:K+-transporting ATPase ATPase A chain